VLPSLLMPTHSLWPDLVDYLPPLPGAGTAAASVSIQNKLSIAKIGVNYKF
jgi:hypothetical protein